MADVFCNDGGSNTSPYETWAKAATTFLTAVDHASAGDDIIIGADHVEDPGANTTYTFPGTAASINRVISSTVGAASIIVYNKADNVQINLTGLFDINIKGFVHFYGVSFLMGDDLFLNTSPSRIVFEDSRLELTRVSGAVIQTNQFSAEVVNIWKNVDFVMTGGGTSSGFNAGANILFEWHGGSISWAGTQPTALFNAQNGNGQISVSGVDLSTITTALFDVSDGSDFSANIHHCLLNSGVSLTTGTINKTHTKVLMSGCDDTTGNDLYRLEYVDYWGSTVHDDAIFLNASDGTQAISWKMVSTANAVEFSEPTKSPPIYSWVDATGSTTFTVNCLWDSVTNIQNDEVWLEIEFLEASADVDSAFADDRMADITATPADQTTNAEVWTESLTNDNEFAVAVTVTVNRVGPVIARVCLAKPSTTIYVDPLIVKS